MASKRDLLIVGGGPAGMMAGLLFARSRCDVLVLEKHADFFRDFRGDTVHPSTMEILDQLGMLGRFLDFLRQEAKAFPGFNLVMESPVTGFVKEDGRIWGLGWRMGGR